MVLDLGFVGDTVHLLPALWMVRRAYPEAELHAAVAEHVTSLMACVPWVDRVWGYPRFPKHATLRQNLRMVARLRAEHFDVLLNLNGSDRSSWLTYFSRARVRLGRMPADGGPPFWRRMFTDYVRYDVRTEPIYVQRCRCLEQCGFPFTQPEFQVRIDPAQLQAAGLTVADANTYFHLNPFTTADRKELPREQLVELIATLQQEWPARRWILSGAPTERERAKMRDLLARLPRKPWRVYAGELSLIQWAAVIRHSAAHLCGDSGSLHIALMTGTPSVAWFRPYSGMKEWIPIHGPHQVLIGSDADPDAVRGIATADLVKAVRQALQTPGR